MYVHIHTVHVDIPDCVQLYSGKIPGYGRVWRVGGNGDRLGIPRSVLCNPLFQGKLEKESDCVNRKKSFSGVVNREPLFYSENTLAMGN